MRTLERKFSALAVVLIAAGFMLWGSACALASKEASTPLVPLIGKSWQETFLKYDGALRGRVVAIEGRFICRAGGDGTQGFVAAFTYAADPYGRDSWEADGLCERRLDMLDADLTGRYLLVKDSDAYALIVEFKLNGLLGYMVLPSRDRLA